MKEKEPMSSEDRYWLWWFVIVAITIVSVSVADSLFEYLGKC